MISLSNVIISTKTLGSKLLLTRVRAAYVYSNGVKTDTIEGYSYEIVCPGCNYEKIAVRIEGNQQLDSPEEAIPVCFDGLELFIYYNVSLRSYQLGARAKAIHPANAVTNKT